MKIRIAVTLVVLGLLNITQCFLKLAHAVQYCSTLVAQKYVVLVTYEIETSKRELFKNSDGAKIFITIIFVSNLQE